MAKKEDSGRLKGDELENALRQAYRKAAEESQNSVLARIAAKGGETPRVLLRDFAEQDTPVVSPDSPETSGYSGRYQVMGELARGGVGVVLRGRDVDLGRDVALKVLRSDHAGNQDVIRRFIEEAQIGGQLQHPGIVPVYELGVKGDQRPFFTMKLIKGKTLAALLQERKDPGEDRPRFLTIFAQVCQTVAYAHARGVIHRDLKPSNIMVGAFGEVQVVDWGFAKILSQGGVADEERSRASLEPADVTEIRTVRTGSEDSDSHAGSVMGTPAYMPPEQALGQVDKLDTRSDVFALGAILLEILTGRPPYVTESGNLLVQAAQSKLADAFDLLDASGVEPVLVDLTKRCLAPTQPARPHDASRLAAEITTHLHAVENRARQAEVDGAKAAVRAQAERKARKLTMGLAAALLLAVLFGSGGLFWVEAKEQSRIEQAARVVRGAIEEARGLEGEARKDRSLWPRAVTAAEKAVALAAEHDAGADLAAGAADLFAGIQEQAGRAEINAGMLRRLAEIRATRGDQLNLKAADEAYAAAFEPFGLDNPAAAAAAAAAMKETGIAEELAAYLDDWMWLRGLVDLPCEDLLETAKLADTDEWRNLLRKAAAKKDSEELLRLAGAIAPRYLAIGNLPNLLALHLSSNGKRDEAIRVLTEAQHLRPGDFWVNYRLGYELTLLIPPRWSEAIGHFRVALAANSESIEVRHQLGIALFKTGLYEKSIRVLEDLLARYPDYLHAYDHIIEAAEKNGTLDELIAAWEKPADWKEHYRLGRALEVKSEWARVIEQYQAASKLEPSALLLSRIGLAHHYAGELEASLAAHRRAVALDPDQSEYLNFLGAVFYDLNMVDEAEATARKAIEVNPYDPFVYSMLGEVQLRRRRYEEAEETFRKALKVRPEHSISLLHISRIYGTQFDWIRTRDILEQILVLPDRFAEGRFWMSFMIGPGPFDRRAFLGTMANQVAASHQLGTVHLLLGDLDLALHYYRKSVELEPDRAAHHANIALMLEWIGDSDAAVRHARRAVELDPDMWLARFQLPTVLLAVGDLEGSRRAHKQFMEKFPWGDAMAEIQSRYEREWEEAVLMRGQFDRILNGTMVYASVRDKRAAAHMAQTIGYHAASARLFEEVFREDPELGKETAPWPLLWHWVATGPLAALPAVAGIGSDAKDLTEGEKRELRQMSLEWMKRDVALWREGIAAGKPEYVKQEWRQLWAWINRWEYAAVRAKTRLEKLPADEREQWETFWAPLRRRHEELMPD